MQIDNAPSVPNSPVSDFGGDTGQLSRYLGALRRRWPVLIVCVVLGAVVGWVTTPKAETVFSASTTRYYRATHTLIADNPSSSTTGENNGTVSLQQAAFLVGVGDVPTRVANKLGLSVPEVTSSVVGSARSDVSGVEVTAYNTDPTVAVTIADTSASELLAYLGESATARYNKERDDVLARLDSLKSQRVALEQQLAITTPEQRPTQQPELDSVINQYRVTYEQFQQLATRGLPSAGLRTIEAATPVEIGDDAYSSAKESIVLGPDQNNAASPTTTAAPKKSTLPAAPPSPPVRAGAGGFLGLLIGIAFVLSLDRFDTRLRGRDAVEAATGLAVLSEIPPLDRKEQHLTHVLAASEPRSTTAESYRVVRTSYVFARGDTQRHEDEGVATGDVIMITSPSPGEGKTTSVANLAAVFAEGGQSVLVIDCDFRRPRIHKYLADDISLDPEAVRERDSLAIGSVNGQLHAVASDIPGVHLVTGIGEAFPDANPIEIVAYQRQIIEFARAHFDVVLLDTAPFLTTNDASELLEETDAVLLIVRSGKTPFASARRAAEFLKRLGAPVLGVVVTSSADASAAQYYYHYYLENNGGRRKRTEVAAGARQVGSNANGNGSDPTTADLEDLGSTRS